MPGRVEILSEESDFVAGSESYALKLKEVKDYAPRRRKGWMGAIYFQVAGELSISANTDMFPTREETLTEGIDHMLDLQAELDEEVEEVIARLPKWSQG